MRLKADLTLLLVSIIWGSAFVAQRVAGQMGSVYLFNGARYLLAALVVLPLALRVGRASNMKPAYPRDQYKWMLIAGFLLFLGSALQQAGMIYTTAGNAGFITSLYVVLVPFALLIVWGEKPHWLSVVAVILAGVGVRCTGEQPVSSKIPKAIICLSSVEFPIRSLHTGRFSWIAPTSFRLVT